jgi:hypothetical protein
MAQRWQADMLPLRCLARVHDDEHDTQRPHVCAEYLAHEPGHPHRCTCGFEWR